MARYRIIPATTTQGNGTELWRGFRVQVKGLFGLWWTLKHYSEYNDSPVEFDTAPAAEAFIDERLSAANKARAWRAAYPPRPYP